MYLGIRGESLWSEILTFISKLFLTQTRKLFYTDYTKGAIFNSSSVYNDKKFTGSISSHPFKKPDVMFRLHQFFLELRVAKAEKELGDLKKQLARVQKITHKEKAFP